MLKIPEPARRLAVATLTPIKFARETGHFRSSLRAQAETADGAALPWYTFPAIDYLSTLDFSGCRVCEFGSGQSTLWWVDRAESVMAIESDAQWYQKVSGSLSGRANLEYHLVEDPAEYVQKPLGREFDVVVVDGAERVRSAESALEIVAEDGLVIVDNSEAHWGPPPGYPIIDACNEAGLARVDFHGFAAGVYRQQCTSLFFGRIDRLVRLPPPQRKYDPAARRPR